MKISKNTEKRIARTTPPRNRTPIKVERMSHPDIAEVGIHTFLSGEKVKIFEISDYRALNILIGYAKFINADYGSVFYRGENHLHNTLNPSISRKSTQMKYEEALSSVINAAIKDEKFAKFSKLSGFKGRRNPFLVVEATLQHYGYSTHFIDVVDNHWVALWFGLNSFRSIKNLDTYCLYEQRIVNPIDVMLAKEKMEEDIYQYMILLAVDDNAAPVERGIYFGNDIIKIDLRSSLPSTFLRPHAQHGLVIRKNLHESQESYDLSRNVVAIIKLRIDKVASWIGSGNLLTMPNLFPSPAFDYGYEILQKRQDLFENKYHKIANYV